jgi:hypothetical protein
MRSSQASRILSTKPLHSTLPPVLTGREVRHLEPTAGLGRDHGQLP